MAVEGPENDRLRKSPASCAISPRHFQSSPCSDPSGLPKRDEPQVQAWGRTLLRFVWDPKPALASANRMRRYLAGVVMARRSDPGDDLISLLTQASYEDRRLTDSEIFAAILALFAAGSLPAPWAG